MCQNTGSKNIKLRNMDLDKDWNLEDVLYALKLRTTGFIKKLSEEDGLIWVVWQMSYNDHRWANIKYHEVDFYWKMGSKLECQKDEVYKAIDKIFNHDWPTDIYN